MYPPATLTQILSNSPKMMSPVLVTVAARLVLALLVKRAPASSRRTAKDLPPGPASLPFIGNMHQLLWNKPMVIRWIHRLLNEMDTDMVSLKLGSVHVTFVTCPEIAREVTRKNEAVLFSRPATFASELFSYGYRTASLTTADDQWKKMRRVLTSEVLSPGMERRFHGRRAEKADELVRYVCTQVSTASDGRVSVRHVARRFCGSAIRRLVFGNRCFSKSPGDASPGADEEEHVDALFTLELMFASVVYPSNTVEWELTEMTNKPEVMQKAVDELDSVGRTERLVQESDICKLNYLKSCIREAFRLHPYHAINPPRVATEDTTVAGYRIPKGSHVILSRIGLGKNPKVWAEPLEFRPERHLNGEAAVALTEPDLRFITFGAGRRACPGVSLGTSFTMVLFARLLQGFRWSMPPGVDEIDLREAPASLALSEPLVLKAEPRLAADVYAPR